MFARFPGTGKRRRRILIFETDAGSDDKPKTAPRYNRLEQRVATAALWGAAIHRRFPVR
jgi:hypothetical protein